MIWASWGSDSDSIMGEVQDPFCSSFFEPFGCFVTWKQTSYNTESFKTYILYISNPTFSDVTLCYMLFLFSWLDDIGKLWGAPPRLEEETTFCHLSNWSCLVQPQVVINSDAKKGVCAISTGEDPGCCLFTSRASIHPCDRCFRRFGLGSTRWNPKLPVLTPQGILHSHRMNV